MRYVVTRDMTPEGDVVIWKEGSDPQMDEQDGQWDIPGETDHELLVVECLYNDFEAEYGLEIKMGEKKNLELTAEWV